MHCQIRQPSTIYIYIAVETAHSSRTVPRTLVIAFEYAIYFRPVNTSLKYYLAVQIFNLEPWAHHSKTWQCVLHVVLDAQPSIRSSGSSGAETNLLAPTNNSDLAPEDDVQIRELNQRAMDLLTTFSTTAHLTDVVEAGSLLRTAIELTPEGHEYLPNLLVGRAIALRQHFKHAGDLSIVEECISSLQRAIQLTPAGHQEVPVRLTELAQSLLARFLHAGDLEGIEEIESTMHRALANTKDGDPQLPLRYCTFGTFFLYLFQRRGNMFHITEAIRYLKRAVAIFDLVDKDSASLPDALDNLGVAYSSRFQSTGDLSDISESISTHRRALTITPEAHPSLASHLGNMGSSLILRYGRTGDLPDLSEGISALERSISLTPRNHEALPYRLCNLAVSFRDRYPVAKDRRDIIEAVASARAAVELTPEGHAEKPARLSILGVMLHTLFDEGGDICDIDAAISAITESMKLTKDDHAVLRKQLASLGRAFHARFLRTREQSDIDCAISSQERAVQETWQGHADLPVQFSNLARSLYDRACFLGTVEDLEQSVACYRSAAQAGVGPPGDRLQAAISWVSILDLHYPQSPAIFEAFDDAIALVTMAAGLEHTVQRRYTQLKGFPELATQAAASACSLQRPDKALEWLEQGRCLVWNQLNQLRTPLDDLRAHDPTLAETILEVSRQLQDTGVMQRQASVHMPLQQKMAIEQEGAAHLNLVKKWEELVEKVRLYYPALENFLQPLQCPSIMQYLPRDGPIVIINVSPHRCDALALIAGLDQPLHIPLPSFSLEKGIQYRQDLSAELALHGMRGEEGTYDDEQSERAIGRYRRQREADGATRRVLGRMWVELVKPVLGALGFSVSDFRIRVTLQY